MNPVFMMEISEPATASSAENECNKYNHPQEFGVFGGAVEFCPAGVVVWLGCDS